VEFRPGSAGSAPEHKLVELPVKSPELDGSTKACVRSSLLQLFPILCEHMEEHVAFSVMGSAIRCLHRAHDLKIAPDRQKAWVGAFIHAGFALGGSRGTYEDRDGKRQDVARAAVMSHLAVPAADLRDASARLMMKL
jgi:hypothetical protein